MTPEGSIGVDQDSIKAARTQNNSQMNQTITSIKIENQNRPTEVRVTEVSQTMNTPINEATWSPVVKCEFI